MVADFPHFDAHSSTIDEYIEELEDHLNAHHGQCAEDRKLSALKMAIGEEGKKVIRTFTAEQRNTYVNLKAALREHFRCKHLTFVERNTFYGMYMEEGENIDSYATRLRTQAAKCNFRVMCRAATPAIPAAVAPAGRQNCQQFAS